METLHYSIEFYAPWHCGSGLAAGADVDALVVKDKQGMPFIPGKTIKGLIREAVEDLLTFRGTDVNKINQQLSPLFGLFNEEEKAVKGELFFHNAELSEMLRKKIDEKKLQKHLYEGIASTAIDKDGIAKKHSLRRMEVVVPCKLFGKIEGVNDNSRALLIEGMKMIKRLGVNRNRGLGRCTFTVVEQGGEK